METSPSIVEILFERIEAYGKTTFELSKLKALDTTSTVLSSLVSRLIVFIVMTLFVVFLSIGVALYVGDMLEKPSYGFLIVAAFYLVAGTILRYSLDKWIKKPVSNLLASHII